MSPRLAAALLPVLLLAGCTPTVALTPAPDATATGCAGVVVALRGQPIAGIAQRLTDAQGTAAWGDPASVVLTCGVPVPELTQEDCYPYGGVDWLRENRLLDGRERVVLTAYGRVPAVQVVVDPALVSVSDVLPVVSEPVATSTRTTDRRCIAVTDAPAPSPSS